MNSINLPDDPAARKRSKGNRFPQPYYHIFFIFHRPYNFSPLQLPASTLDKVPVLVSVVESPCDYARNAFKLRGKRKEGKKKKRSR